MLSLISLVLCVDAGVPDAGVPEENTLHMMKRLSGPLETWAKTPWVKAWARAANELSVAPNTVWISTKDRSTCVPEAEGAKPGANTKRIVADDEWYYGRIADGLGYASAYEVLAAHGFDTMKGKKVFDFGYGNIGVLAMLARTGVDVTGVEIDPCLPLMYAKDQGPVAARDGTKGRVRVVNGFFPKDSKLVADIGSGYDLFISKNTLKKGYIHPERKVPDDPRSHIELGVSDVDFLKRVSDTLKPGGYFFIYNISPAEAPPDQQFMPWSDGRSPFTKESYEKAGFEVLAFDVVDDQQMRAMAHVLEWDVGPEKLDLEKGLFSHYTLVRKPVKR